MTVPTTGQGATFVYVSNAEDGTISTYRLRPDGSLVAGRAARAAAMVMPLAISANRKFLYAAARSKPYTVFSYAIDPASGELSELGKAPIADSMAYISLSKNGRHLFSASYGGHLVSLNAVDADGRVGKILQTVPVSRHAHAIRIDNTNRFVFVPSLGTDQVVQFTFDEKFGRLASNTPYAVQLDEGIGPRHIAISADNKFVYVLSEFLAKVFVFKLDDKTGLLTLAGEASGLPPNSTLTPGKARKPRAHGEPESATRDAWAADIRLSPDGRFLFISERTDSLISAFSVNKGSGLLTLRAVAQTEKQPRGFAVDPTGKFLVASGELSDQVAVHAIGEDGSLKALGRYPGGKGANWVEIITV